MINNLSTLDNDNTTTVGELYYPFDQDFGLDPTMDAANNRTEFTSMTAVGLNTVVAAAVLFNNTILLITLGRTRKLWNSTNAYIASLAAADLLLGVMMVVRNFWIIPETAWVFHTYKNVCVPIVCLLYVSCLESITCLAMVSLDRYAYIVWPFWYERHVTKKLITTSIACSWVVCIAIGFLPMRLNKFSVESGCDPLYIISREYLLYGLNSYLFGAEVFIAAMYGRIYCVGNQQRKKIEAATGGNLRQRFNSKSSGASAYNGANSGRSVSEEIKRSACERLWVKPRAMTVSVIGLSWTQDKAIYAKANDFDNRFTDLTLGSGLEGDTNANDMELKGKKEENALRYNANGAPPHGHNAASQESMQQTAGTSGNTESACDIRKRSIFDRVAKLKKLKKFSFSSTKESIASRWQVIRFLILVCGIFFLCWTPLQIIGILYFTVGTPVIAISVGISFAAINSALNLYILIAMNKTFKAAFLKMVCPASYLSRIKNPQKWRKGEVEFVSDYEPPVRPSLPEATVPSVPTRDGSPQTMNGFVVPGVAQSDKDCALNGNLSQQPKNLGVEEKTHLQGSTSCPAEDILSENVQSSAKNKDKKAVSLNYSMNDLAINETLDLDSVTVVDVSQDQTELKTVTVETTLTLDKTVLHHEKSEPIAQ